MNFWSKKNITYIIIQSSIYKWLYNVIVWYIFNTAAVADCYNQHWWCPTIANYSRRHIKEQGHASLWVQR